MMFYDGSAPSPRRVRIFLAEKGLEIPTTTLELQKGEARTPEFLALNALGQVPVLKLDDGTAITESVAICRYLEEGNPEPPLFGTSRLERAQVEMWNRRMEILFFGALGTIAQHTLPFFAARVTQLPAVAEAQRAALAGHFEWLDGALEDGRPFVAGERFSIADITGMACSMLAGFLKVEIPKSCNNVWRWDEAIRGRPSWDA